MISAAFTNDMENVRCKIINVYVFVCVCVCVCVYVCRAKNHCKQPSGTDKFLKQKKMHVCDTVCPTTCYVKLGLQVNVLFF